MNFRFTLIAVPIAAMEQKSKLISLNVGRPRLTVYKGMTINTGIFKSPVTDRIRMRTLNLDGDKQADLSVHGGPYKAVYGYPSEHYDHWRRELPGVDLPWGAFGENFTTTNLLEEDLHIGDRLTIGTAELMVRQTRMPCYKLAVKFERDDMIERFLDSGRSGFYFSVEREGDVSVEDLFEIVSRDPRGITIAEMNALIASDRYNRELLERAVATPALPDHMKEYFAKRLRAPAKHSS
jgi:MOSC domain-containing protein YiiM